MKQLSANEIKQVQTRIATLGSVTLAAKELGISRSSLSMALAGKYPADTKALSLKIKEAYTERLVCPHQNIEMKASLCREIRSAQFSASSPTAVRQWQACLCCIHNPKGATL